MKRRGGGCCELCLRGHLQNHVFAPASAAGSDFDGEVERERATIALTGAGDEGSMEEAVWDAEYHLVLEYKIEGPLTYLTASTHCKRFADVAVDHVLLNLSRVTRIDLDGIEALEVPLSGETERGNAVAVGLGCGAVC